MHLRKSHLMPLLTGGFFFCLDQILKFIAHGKPSTAVYLVKPWLGWEYLANPGIAFSFPFPNAVLIIGTPLILIGLFVYIGKIGQRSIYQVFGASFIFFGAISNLIDRILFGITIDYFRVFTAVLNIADIMIVLGTLLILTGTSSRTEHNIDKTEQV